MFHGPQQLQRRTPRRTPRRGTRQGGVAGDEVPKASSGVLGACWICIFLGITNKMLLKMVIYGGLTHE